MRRVSSHRRHPASAALAVPVVLALCCGAATPALAAARGRVTPHKATAHKAVVDPLLGVRDKGLADVTVYGRRLATVLQAGATSTVLSSDEQGQLGDAGVDLGVALRADRIAVMRAKTRMAIVTAVTSAQRTVAVGALELAVSTAAETHLAAGNSIGDQVATLTTEATTAAAAGDDTSDLTDDLDSVSIDLESAQADEATAVTDVLTLTADAALADLKAAAAIAADDLATIDSDISDATDDLATAQGDYDALSSDDGTDPGTDPGDGGGDGS